MRVCRGCGEYSRVEIDQEADGKGGRIKSGAISTGHGGVWRRRKEGRAKTRGEGLGRVEERCREADQTRPDQTGPGR